MNFNENEVAYLEIIQSVITRMAQNGFLIKGWAITIITALAAFALGKAENAAVWVLMLLMVTGFWYLDAFFLKTERQYRALYAQAVNKEAAQLFNLALPTEIIKQHRLYKSFFSATLLVFYGIIYLVILMLWLLKAN